MSKQGFAFYFFIAESLAWYVVLHKSSEKSEVCLNHATSYVSRLFEGQRMLLSFIIQIYLVQKLH